MTNIELYSDTRTAIFVRYMTNTHPDLDPIEVYTDWLMGYKAYGSCDPATGEVIRAMVQGDDDGDDFNFELHAILRVCFGCGESFDENELFLANEYPICLTCAPEYLGDFDLYPDNLPNWYPSATYADRPYT